MTGYEAIVAAVAVDDYGLQHNARIFFTAAVDRRTERGITTTFSHTCP